MTNPGRGFQVDDALLRRVGRREEAALAELYDRCAPTLLGVIRRVVTDAAEAEDVLQEVFLQVWNRGDTYDSAFGTPQSWLVRVARNRAIDRYRAVRTRAHLSDRPLEDAPEGHVTSRGPDPEAATVQTLESGRVAAAMATLTADQRVLVELAFFEGLTHTELAARCGLPLGTVKTRVRTALQRLRTALVGSAE